MAVGAAAAAVGGSLIQIEGQRKANKAEANAHRTNAEFFRKQADQVAAATRREFDIFKSNSEQFVGQQKGAFAKGGVDMSGSALLKVAATEANIQRELVAIKEQGFQNANIQFMKASESDRRAGALLDPDTQASQSSGTLLTGFGGAASALSRR